MKLEAIIQPQRQQAGKPGFATALNNEDQYLAINLGNYIIHVSFSYDKTGVRRVKKCKPSNFSYISTSLPQNLPADTPSSFQRRAISHDSQKHESAGDAVSKEG